MKTKALATFLDSMTHTMAGSELYVSLSVKASLEITVAFGKDEKITPEKLEQIISEQFVTLAKQHHDGGFYLGDKVTIDEWGTTG